MTDCTRDSRSAALGEAGETMSMLSSRALLAAALMFAAAAGCGDAPGTLHGPCRGEAPECNAGLACVSGRCEAASDADDVTGDLAIDAEPGDAADARDAFDGSSDAADAFDAATDTARDVPQVDAPICPAPAADAATCLGRGVVDYTLGSMVCGNATGASAIASTSCQPLAGGPEAMFGFDVTATTGVAFTVRAGFDSILSIRSMCSDTAGEIACNDVSGTDASSSLRTVLDPGHYVAVVDQFGNAGSGGAFTIESQTFTAAANARCTTARMLSAGASVTDESIASGDSSPTLCRTVDRGAERFYTISVPAGSTLAVTATMHGGWRIAMHIVDGCTSTANCLADALGTTTTPNPTIHWTNNGPAARDVTFAIASVSEPVADTDRYDLAIAFTP